MRFIGNNAESIGNTPLIRINRSISSAATVLAKIEGRNPEKDVFTLLAGFGAMAAVVDAGVPKYHSVFGRFSADFHL